MRNQHQLFSEKGSIFTANQYCYSDKSETCPQPVINVIVVSNPCPFRHYPQSGYPLFSFCLFVILSFCLFVFSPFMSFCLFVFLSFCLFVFVVFLSFVFAFEQKIWDGRENVLKRRLWGCCDAWRGLA